MPCDKLPPILGVFLVNVKGELTYMGEYATHLLTSPGPASFGQLAFEQAQVLGPHATWWPIGFLPDLTHLYTPTLTWPWLSETTLFTPLLARGDGRVIGFVTRES